MKDRRKRVKRGDGSSYRWKSKRGRWGTEGRAVHRGREGGRDWTWHERWKKVSVVGKSHGGKKAKKGGNVAK